jgi:hypothetical protein
LQIPILHQACPTYKVDFAQCDLYWFFFSCLRRRSNLSSLFHLVNLLAYQRCTYLSIYADAATASFWANLDKIDFIVINQYRLIFMRSTWTFSCKPLIDMLLFSNCPQVYLNWTQLVQILWTYRTIYENLCKEVHNLTNNQSSYFGLTVETQGMR